VRPALPPLSRFLSFAFERTGEEFRNFLSYGPGDGWARSDRTTATAALCGRWGTVLGRSTDSAMRGASGQLFEAAVPARSP